MKKRGDGPVVMSGCEIRPGLFDQMRTGDAPSRSEKRASPRLDPFGVCDIATKAGPDR